MEEADETEYWLNVIDGLNWGAATERAYLLKEGDEILRVLASIKNSLWKTMAN